MSAATGTWAERCAADAEARDWALEYGRGEFYYSEKWGELTAVGDGVTTLTDVADALVRGDSTPYQETLAAAYFAEAADYLAGVEQGKVTTAAWGHLEAALTDDNGDVPRLVDHDELDAAERARDVAAGLRDECRRVQDAAVDAEQDHRRWLEAESEDEYHAAGARAALAAEVTRAWAKAVDVEYDEICADYGNDGHPENDRHISAEDKTAQTTAVAEIAERTGLPTGAVWDAVRDVADDYALDHTGTRTLGQPEWDQVADKWAEMEAIRAGYEADWAAADAATDRKLAEVDPLTGDAGVLAAEEAAIGASIEAAWGPDAEERAAADTHSDPAGWPSTLDIDVPEWVATQGGQTVADYLARVAAETSETVGTEDQPPAGSAGDGPTTTIRADRDLVAAAEETRAAAYEAGDRLRQAQQRDADDETHQSAVDLEQAEAEAGAAEQDAAEAAAALAAELAGDDPEPRGKPDGEPSTEELVAAAREACAELADDQDEIADPVADVPVVDESAVADDAAVVAAQDTVGGAA